VQSQAQTITDVEMSEHILRACIERIYSVSQSDPPCSVSSTVTSLFQWNLMHSIEQHGHPRRDNEFIDYIRPHATFSALQSTLFSQRTQPTYMSADMLKLALMESNVFDPMKKFLARLMTQFRENVLASGRPIVANLGTAEIEDCSLCA